MKVIYTLVIIIYTGLIHVFSLFNKKALLWVKGRKNWSKLLKEKFEPGDKTIWVHCASLGEFEQGRPIIEMIKGKAPEYKILLTFFSPSGYEVTKSWPLADFICYLPADTPGNAARFIEIARPSIVLFIKYEFWNNYLSALYKRKIPFYLVSGIFRPEQYFFKWYGGFFRNILKKFTHFFVQDSRSVELLRSIGVANVSQTGDTRFDRVAQIAEAARTLPVIERFKGSEKIFMAGSSWRPDEEIIVAYINRFPERMKWIFAPHEIDKSNIERLEKLFKVKVMKYSLANENSYDARVMIIDNIGMLSSAYRYADVAEVGGGFGSGIHNILEPACWGIPILFGPDHTKYREATDLISANGAFCFKDYNEFAGIIDKLLGDKEIYEKASKTVSDYIKNNTGATEKIFAIVLKERY
jgi:3-deoxy-D-manno-octulosonic-acid transferase